MATLDLNNYYSFKLSTFGGSREDSLEVTYNFPNEPTDVLIINRSEKDSETPLFTRTEVELDKAGTQKLTKLFLGVVEDFKLGVETPAAMDGISVSLYIGTHSNSMSLKFYNLPRSQDAGTAIVKLMRFILSKLDAE